MPIRKFKPTSPGRRFMSISGFDEITTDTPEKTLTESIQTHAGRNNQGRITTRHQGGGYRKIYRKIDFKRDKHGVPGKVATIEYDPNRSARIALINYKDGEIVFDVIADNDAKGPAALRPLGADHRIGRLTVDHMVASDVCDRQLSFKHRRNGEVFTGWRPGDGGE